MGVFGGLWVVCLEVGGLEAWWLIEGRWIDRLGGSSGHVGILCIVS